MQRLNINIVNDVKDLQGLVETHSPISRQYLNMGFFSLYHHNMKGSWKAIKEKDVEDMQWVSSDKKITYTFKGSIKDSEQIDYFSSPPLFSFTRKKKLITTDISGGSEIIEQWNMRGYEIRMRGLLVDMAKHHFPESKVKNMKELFESTQTFSVKEGKVFTTLGIAEIYISDWSLQSVEGFQDTFSYTMTAQSITPQTFKLED